MNKLNNKMIELARESRGFTQTELAEKLDIPQGSLSRMERGELGVKQDVIDKLCEILNYPESFFFQEKKISVADTHYRKSIIVDRQTKLAAEAMMNIYKFNVEEMLKSVDVKLNVPVLNDQYDSPGKVARYLRSYWKVERGAIFDLCGLIESNGIIIIYIDFGTDMIEGRTIVTDTGHPIIFINKKSSTDRQRLTLAHELGHVIMHVNAMPIFTGEEESSAFEFACEFLMPYSECQYDLNEKTTVEKLVDLKRYWKVSIQSMLYRMKSEKLHSANRNRYLWSIVVAKGWRKVEPIEITQPNPSLLKRMAAVIERGLGFSLEDFSRVFCLNVDEIKERYFETMPKLKIV